MSSSVEAKGIATILDDEINIGNKELYIRHKTRNKAQTNHKIIGVERAYRPAVPASDVKYKKVQRNLIRWERHKENETRIYYICRRQACLFVTQ